VPLNFYCSRFLAPNIFPLSFPGPAGRDAPGHSHRCSRWRWSWNSACWTAAGSGDQWSWL